MNKLTKAEKKKFIENAPKVEDFCEFLYSHNLLLVSRNLPQFRFDCCNFIDSFARHRCKNSTIKAAPGQFVTHNRA